VKTGKFRPADLEARSMSSVTPDILLASVAALPAWLAAFPGQ
jgi:hypothetical protein